VVAVTTWTRHEPRVAPAGDVGGDHQVSEAFSARWSAPLPCGLFAVVTRSFYATDFRGPVMDCDTEYAVCRDPQRPGDTEMWSGGTVTHWSNRTDEASVRLAAELADPPTVEEWSSAAPQWAVA
jgi:hypothetical protein